MKPIRSSVKIWSGCAPGIAAAIHQFEADCTTSHTMQSKRWSLLKLLGMHVEPALKTYMDGAENGWYKNFFQLMKGKKSGQIYIANMKPAWSRQEDCFSLGAGLVPAMKTCAIELDRNLQIEIERRQTQGNWSEELQATFETLRELAFFCRTRTSTRGINKAEPRLRGADRQSQRGGGMHTPYCELCWRLSSYEAAGGDEGRVPAGRSKRFCDRHDPKDHSSRYRTDHRHRSAFHTTLAEIYSNWDQWHEFMGNMSEDEVRRWAYEYIRNLPTELRLNAITLKTNGLSNSEIAEELAVSRAAITKILNSPIDYRCVIRFPSFPTKAAGRKRGKHSGASSIPN